MRVSQLGIALGALGAMLAFMGLFPGVTGVASTPGIGVVQIFAILVGFSLLISGAMIYVKFSFYATTTANLVQQIGLRLGWTGLVMAAMTGLADVLGFGSHINAPDSSILIGPLQGAGVLLSYAISAVGVLVYALGGSPETDEVES